MLRVAQIVLESLVRVHAGLAPLSASAVAEINVRFAVLASEPKADADVVNAARLKLLAVNDDPDSAEFVMLAFVAKFGDSEQRALARHFVLYRNRARKAVLRWLRVDGAVLPGCTGCVKDPAGLRCDLRELARAFSARNRAARSVEDLWRHISAVGAVYERAAVLAPCACSVRAVADVNEQMRAENLAEDLATRVGGTVTVAPWNDP